MYDKGRRKLEISLRPNSPAAPRLEARELMGAAPMGELEQTLRETMKW